MALTFFWRCEGETLDGTHDYTAGDNTAAPNGTAGVDNATVKVGTNSHNGQDGADYYTIVLSSSDIIQSEGSAGFWFYPDGWTATQVLWRAFDASASADRIEIQLTGSSTSGGLTLTVGDAGVGDHSASTGDLGMTNGNWYFVVIRWSDSAGDIRIEVYDNALAELTGSPAENLSATRFPSVWNNLDTLRLGYQLGTGNNFHCDNYFIADAYSEDLVSNANITSYTSYGAATSNPNFMTLLGVG